MFEIKIDKTSANQRADKFVRKYLNDAPLSFIYKTFRKKDVKINGKRIKENYILQENDVLRVYVADEQLKEFNNPKKIEDLKANLDIVYEDQNVLILNKPKGILVHGDAEEKRITLTNLVQSYLYKKGEFKNDGVDFVPSPCHRLDRNTSGLVVFAKNLMTVQMITEKFKDHENIDKRYLLLVDGKIEKDGIIEAPLMKDADSGFVKVGSLKNGAKSAKTLYHVVWANKEYSLVEATLKTGRTHQLRVHFQYIGHPIMGDQKYGNFEANKKFKNRFDYDSQFLHAHSIEFHNLEGELAYLNDIKFVATLGDKEQRIIEKIR